MDGMDQIVRVLGDVPSRCVLCDSPAAWSVWPAAVGEHGAVALCRTHASAITRDRRVFGAAASSAGWPEEPASVDGDDDTDGEDWEGLVDRVRALHARPGGVRPRPAPEPAGRRVKPAPRRATLWATHRRPDAAAAADDLRSAIERARRRIRQTASAAARDFSEPGGRPEPGG
jgi:hypothetical protein